MGMSPAKWQQRTRKRGFEQRAKAKARLLPPRPEKKETWTSPWNLGDIHIDTSSGSLFTFSRLSEVIDQATASLAAVTSAFSVPSIIMAPNPPIQLTVGVDPGTQGWATIPVVHSPYVTPGHAYIATNPQYTYTPSNITAADPYSFYNQGSPMAYSAATAGAWYQWNQTGSITVTDNWEYKQSVWTAWNEAQTPRQRREVERGFAAERNRQQQVHQNRERARDEAFKRALGLFVSCLTDEERTDYEKKGCIHVRGSRGRRYRIHCRGMGIETRDEFGLGNVDVLDGGQVSGRLCAHPNGIPEPDMWLAQKLILEHDEDEFVRTANVHWGQRPELAAA